MKFLNSIRVAVKLPVVMVTLSLMALVVTTVLSYMHARNSLAEEAEIRLLTIAKARAGALETLVMGVERDLDLQARNPLLHDAFLGFRNSLSLMPGDPGAHLVEWYRARNPHGPDAYAMLDAAGDGSAYSRAHGTFHPYFRALTERSVYQDIYMIDPSGTVIYSVLKDRRFGQSVGQSADFSGLSHAFAKASETRGSGLITFVDFALDRNSDGALSSYIGKEILDPTGRFLGILVFRLPILSVDQILQDTAGFGPGGTAGEAYLVAADGRLRSDSRLLGSGRALETSVDMSLLDVAQAGNEGVREARSLTGIPIFAAHAPMRFFDQTWMVIAEREQALQLASAHELLRKIIANIVFLLAAICALGIIFARSVSIPLVAVGGAMRKIAARDLESGIPCLRRGDEIGDIAKSLEVLRDELRGAAKVQAENHFKSAAFQGSSAASMIVDSDRIIRYINPAAHRLLGDHAEAFRENLPSFSPDNVVGHSMDLFHGAHSKAAQRLDSLTEFPLSVDIKVGEARFALMVNVVCDPDGSRIGYVVEWQDVTVERMQKAVIAAIHRHQCTAEFSTSGVLEACNACLSDCVGAGALITGRSTFETLVVGCDDTDRSGAEIWDMLVGGTQTYGRFRCMGADGTERWLEGSISPVMDRQNTALKYLLMAADVTASHKSLAAADEQRKTLETEQAQVVTELSVGLKYLSEGNLAARLEAPFAPRYDQLRCDFNGAVSRLNETLCAVIENATAIRSEAREISNAADDLSHRTEKQAGTLEETAAALDELTASVRSAADGASRANMVVVDARENAVSSGAVVKEAVSAMELIETSSGKISKIINVIDDIAFQTNLLALNAGVEAARAGDAGRGFAVVASEVRALAQRSSEAAKEIGALILTSSNHVSRGVDLVAQAGHALEEIVEAVGGIADHVAEISGSAQQQSAGLAEINASVNQLDQVTQQNAAMFEETTAASHSLTREAQNLTDMIAKFKTERRQTSRPVFEAITPPGVLSHDASSAAVPEGSAKHLAPFRDHSGGRNMALACSTEVQDDNSWDEF
jgi:methyl-accepting chemotaxis protein